MNGLLRAPFGLQLRIPVHRCNLARSNDRPPAKFRESPGDDVPGYSCYTIKRFSPLMRIPEESDAANKDTEDLYEVRIIDNDRNTYEEVIVICMMALDVDPESAYTIAWEVDHHGSCAVAVAPLDIAESLAEVIRTIGIEVQVNRVPGCPVDR